MLHTTAAPAQAQTMSNDNYIIRTQDFNPVSAVTAGENNLKPTAGNTESGLEGVNFNIKTGFESLASAPPFSILLSSGIVDFGALSPTNPIIRTVDLSTNSEIAYGYSVIVFENQPLTATATDEAFIPDTTCDNGACGTENASAWVNALTYGFGYRCDNIVGIDCNSSFASSNSYKRFPNIDSNDDPQPVMAGIGSNNKKIRISYKVNVSGNQAQDIYNNIITYIAVPNF